MLMRGTKDPGSPKRSFLSRISGVARLRALVLVPLFVAASPSVLAQAPPSLFKDLQVLKKDITKDELKSIMKAQGKALGVDCDFCHKSPDMAAETNKKKIAREMMQMVAELNRKYPGLMKKVTCNTCHRGKAEPEATPTGKK